MDTFRHCGQQSIKHVIRLSITLPWLTVFLSIAAALAGLWYTFVTLEFETSRNALASSRSRYIQLKDEVEEDFNKIDYIVVAVEPPNLARGQQFVDTLASRLRADTTHFSEVIEKIDTTELEGKKLLLLSPDELHTLKQRLEDAQDFIFDLSEFPGLNQLLASINQEISKALVTHLTSGFLGLDTGSDNASEQGGQSLDVSFLTELFTEMERAIADPVAYRYRSPWAHFFLDDTDVFSQAGYLTSDNDRFLFVLVDDRSTGGFIKHAIPLRVLRAHIQALRQDFPDVQAGVTGTQALNNDEMVAAQHDTLLATVIALCGVALLFIAAFRQVRRPLLVVFMLMIAVCWTIGFTTLTVGHLNILTVAFVPILIGLGVDFGIHLIGRYGEARAHGKAFGTALHITYQNTGPSVAAAALTTALAFYAVILSNFRGLAELGFIAGSGILLCLLASFTVLPALLALSEQQHQGSAGIWQAASHNAFQGLKRFPRTLLSAIILVTMLGVILLPAPQFDYNLLNLQARDTESVDWEHRLLEGSDRSSWYAVNVADSLDELYRKKARFADLPAVERVASLASLIPQDQDIRLPLVKALAPLVSDASGSWDRPEPIDLDDLHLVMQKIRFKLQRETDDWAPQKRPSGAQLSAARSALLALEKRLRAMPPDASQQALSSFQRQLMADFADKLTLLQDNVAPTPITLENVPPRLRKRFVSKSGRFLLQIFARHNIWERDPMRDFVSQLETVDTQITGAPIVAYYSIQQMQHGYLRGGLYALLVIIGIVFLLFRRLKPMLIALLPLLLGGLWTMAGMAFFDLQFNLANLMILPLFLGIAVDDGLHLVHRMLESPDDAASPLARSTGKSIVLTSLTSMVGFGSLMVAQHFGVFSLGAIATLAIGCALIATIVILPLLLHVWPLSERTNPASAMPDISSNF